MRSAVLLEQVTPRALEAALAVQQAILQRAHETAKLRPRQGARAQEDAEGATRRLMAVAPANRHVAQT